MRLCDRAKNVQGMVEEFKPVVFTLNSHGHKVEMITTNMFLSSQTTLGQLGFLLEHAHA